METVSYHLFKPTGEQPNNSILCQSFDTKSLRPEVTRAWYESFLSIRQGKTVYLYISEICPVPALALWLGIAAKEQELCYQNDNLVGDIFLMFFDKNSNDYREQYFGHEDSFELIGTSRKPRIPEDFV